MTVNELVKAYNAWEPYTRVHVWIDGVLTDECHRVYDLPRFFPSSEYEIQEFGFAYIQFSKINSNEINYAYFEGEVVRCYNILGEHADCQNEIDIKRWYEEGLITKDDMKRLIKFNNHLSKAYYN